MSSNPSTSTGGGAAAHLAPEDPAKGLESRPFELLVGFSNEEKHVREMEQLLLCVRCRLVPNPIHYYTCDLCDHLICGRCAYSQQDPEGEDEQSQIRGGLNIATCPCSTTAAPIKGPERILKVFIQNSWWDCVNSGSGGCDACLRGWDWAEHVKNCQRKIQFGCHSRNCGFTCFSKDKETIIGHLTTYHGVSEHVSTPNGVIYLRVPFDETAAGQGLHLSLMKLNGRHYLFGSEVVGEYLHMWVWDMEAVPGGKNGTTKCFMKLKPVGDDKDGEILYSATCLPYDVPPERIVEDGESFPVGVERLRKKYLLSSPVKHWKVGIVIKAKGQGSLEGDAGVA